MPMGRTLRSGLHLPELTPGRSRVSPPKGTNSLGISTEPAVSHLHRQNPITTSTLQTPASDAKALTAPRAAHDH